MAINTRDEWKRQLYAILSQDPSIVTHRLQQEYDRLAGPHGDSIVLCGAGVVGKIALDGLRKLGLEPRAFADNNPALWSHTVQGVPVISPAEAVTRFGPECAFVVTIYNGSVVRRQLAGLGCPTIVPFDALFFKYPDQFLPHLNLDLPFELFRQADQVAKAFDLWVDDESRAEYIAQLRYITSLDSSGTLDRLPPEDTYFPADLVHCGNDEVFVDCGAFDGDTLQEFLKRCGGSFRQAFAIEPDPDTFGRLQTYLSSVGPEIRDKVRTHHTALGHTSGPVAFKACGTVYSQVTSGSGSRAYMPTVDARTASIEMNCATLDELLEGWVPTFIKMDIEGAELDALKGARRTIQSASAVLAICNHHTLDDLWKVPLAIHELSGGQYQLYLRRHGEDCWEVMCYGLPPARNRVTPSERLASCSPN
jgi:FkbM family methyltransferase